MNRNAARPCSHLFLVIGLWILLATLAWLSNLQLKGSRLIASSADGKYAVAFDVKATGKYLAATGSYGLPYILDGQGGRPASSLLDAHFTMSLGAIAANGGISNLGLQKPMPQDGPPWKPSLLPKTINRPSKSHSHTFTFRPHLTPPFP